MAVSMKDIGAHTAALRREYAERVGQLNADNPVIENY